MFSTARAVLKFSEEKDGIWVKYADYKKLEEENARLRSLDSLKAVSLTDSTNWQAIGDYAETKEENARLKAEVVHDLNQIGGLQQENARLKEDVEHIKFWNEQLKAENDLLRKAGDAMEQRLLLWHNDDYSSIWLAAKEGKQP